MDRIKVSREEGNFFMIYNEAFRDENLSLKARGLLATIMSLPSTWDFSIEGMASILKEGKTAIYSAIDELIEQGYCARNSIRENGKIKGNEYHFSEKKGIAATSEPHLGFPNMENQDMGNRPQYNIQKNKVSNKETILDREKSFRQKVQEYSSKYPQSMLDAFVRCWTEPNASGTKMRYEMQETFEIGRRLATWASKDYNKQNTPIPPKPATPPSPTNEPHWKQMGFRSREEYIEYSRKQYGDSSIK